MFTNINDVFTMSNGVTIPCVGYGTWQTPSGDIAYESTLAALKAGYRHIDTAAGYGNEADIGRAIRDSGIPREELFITTKHWITERGFAKTVAAAEASMAALGVDYLDLYLIHWPCVEKVSENWRTINGGTWRGFEKLYKDGKIRAIGLSNFLPEQITALMETCEVKPHVNQIEFHPGYYQPELVRWCKEHDILVQAWSPLGCGTVLADPTLAKIAAKHGKTVAQVCLRFALQSGVLPLSKSVHEDRMISNTQLFDFELTAEDMTAIMTMPPIGYSNFHPTEAPADTLYGPGGTDVE